MAAEAVWERVCRRHRLRYLVLFGSRAGGRPDGFSDWDFAARFGRRPSPREYLELLADLVEAVGSERVDLVVLDEPSLPPPLVFEALWRGRPLCVLDREALVWDRVRAASLYWEYRLILHPQAARWLHGLAKRRPPTQG